MMMSLNSSLEIFGIIVEIHKLWLRHMGYAHLMFHVSITRLFNTV